jgi:predicted O-methyltransferase YrrM
MDRAFLDAVAAVPNINTETFGPLLYGYVLALRPKVIVETGAFRGYITCWLGAAAARVGARVYCLDNFTHEAGTSPDVIMSALTAVGVQDSVHIVEGDSVASLKILCRAGALDGLGLIHLDSDHTYEHVAAEIQVIEQKLETGGIISSHDAQLDEFPGVNKAFRELQNPDSVFTWNYDVHWIRHHAGFVMAQKRVNPELFPAAVHDGNKFMQGTGQS